MIHPTPRNRTDEIESTPTKTLYDLLEIGWRRKVYLIGAVAVAMALGVAYLSRIEPKYRVQARVLVRRQAPLLDQARAPKAEEEFLATQAEIIRSPAVVRGAVESLPAQPRDPDAADPVTEALDALNVMPVPGTDVLSISFVGSDPQRATKTVEAVIAAYREYLHQLDHDGHLESLRLLTQSEKELRQDLEVLQEEYRQLRKSTSLIGEGRDAADVQKSLLRHLGERLTECRANRMEMENRMRVMRDGRGTSVVGSPSDPPWVHASLSRSPGGTDAPQSSPDTRAIRLELFKAQSAAEALATQYGPKHPAMRAAEQQVAAWRQRLVQSEAEAAAVLEQELAAARMHERQLADLYRREFEEVKLVDAHLIEEQQVLDRIDRIRTVHDSILTQVAQWQLADQALSGGRSAVRVSTLEAPDVAERLVFPPPSLMLAVCLAMGLVAGVGLIALVERTDARVQSAEQLQERSNRPVLGRIPRLKTPRGSGPRSVYRGRMVRQMPESPAAEAFRALRTRLDIFSDTGIGQVIQVASPRDGEGKTTVTANLAFSFAQLGKKVLVIDTDLREGTLHRVFAVRNDEGLTCRLQDGKPWEASIQRSPLAAVDVLARGREVINPAELLAQERFAELLASARVKYDLVLLDSSALLRVTEPSVSASKADGVLLSAMIGRSSLSEARQACELLDSLNARTLGIVVNQATGPGRSSARSAPADATSGAGTPGNATPGKVVSPVGSQGNGTGR
ncbi:MAG TPA: polysaccharide biosynthesis tyrosine autokinase [Thermoguttaceae bacterium]|nr:polysaccharide biosynthesis tyrosine autokinase [Thermoguttaceae bacterium]